MRIAIAQLNPTVGAFEANLEQALCAVRALAAQEQPPELVVFPAYALTGTPLEGLVWSESFSAAGLEAVTRFALEAPLPTLISTVVPFYGAFEDDELLDGHDGGCACSDVLDAARRDAGDGETCAGVGSAGSAADRAGTLGGDQVGGVQADCRLDSPSDGLTDNQSDDQTGDRSSFLFGVQEVFFCENGSFTPLGFMDEDVDAVGFELDGVQCTVVLDRFLESDEFYEQTDVLIEMMALPFAGTEELPISEGFEEALCADAARNGAWLLLANLVGGQGEMVYPGGSLVLTPYGDRVAGGFCFEEAVFDAEITLGDRDILSACPCSEDVFSDDEALWAAAMLALRDQIHKNGFTDVVIGLSGGIDSAAVAVLAVDTLGAEHVHLVTIPGPYSSDETLADATALAANVGSELFTIPLAPAFEIMRGTFEEVNGRSQGVTQENLQARLRMMYLMAFSNEHAWMMLNTCNRSESAVGYATLYGDTSGGFSPFGSVYKTRLVELLRWRDEEEHVVPEGIFMRPPTAELRPNQKDTDSLPPYEELDAILALYLDEGRSSSEIVSEGFDPLMVDKVAHLVVSSEYKRRQEPVSPTFGALSLVSQRAWPMTNRFSG